MFAPRRRACSISSSTTMPAPSPSTKPSRSLSNGRLACAGSSLRVDSAFIAANPPMPSGVIAASAPPAIIASVSPMRIDFTASPMACADVEHADTGDQFGPLHPYLMVTSPGAMLMIIWRMKKGEALLQRLLVLLLQRAQPADPGADDHAHLLGDVALRLVLPDREAALLHRHFGGRKRVLRVEVHAADLPLVDPLLGEEVLHLGRDAGVDPARIEPGDGSHTGLAGEHRLPVLVHAGSQR